jgi:Na+/H+ antiporter NhaD/arsenite permease-like protein
MKMALNRRLSFFLVLLFIVGFGFSLLPQKTQAQEKSLVLIVGTVIDRQEVPVEGAQVELLGGNTGELLSEALTQANGRFALRVPDIIPDQLSVRIHRAHFQDDMFQMSERDVEHLRAGETISLANITLPRVINQAFWLATAIFVGVLIFIGTGRMHNTLAALAGASLILIISYLSYPLNQNWYIFDFPISLTYIDWNVIFLIMGMMIFIAVVENTGIFQWLAFMAFRVSGGRLLLLMLILMIIAGVASAFLDNVTTMLLMAPITIQIALSLGINPLVLLIPEVLASNVVGISTLIGTPTNILIGSYAHLSFTDFLVNLTPGVMLAFIGLVLYSFLIFRKDLAASPNLSPLLEKKLAESGKITDPVNLKKAGWVGLGMLLLFIFGENLNMPPSVTALVGATALLVWIRPNVEEMIEAVDWTTLVFFMSLFIVVGAIQEVGLISLIAEGISWLVGDSLVLAMMIIIWFSAILSTVVANIPFTAAMLPVIGYLTLTIPGAESNVLFYCLSVGAAMGGNGSLIGASANMVTSGIAERAGYPITYAYFLRKGFPALLITVGLATIWLLIRFL